MAGDLWLPTCVVWGDTLVYFWHKELTSHVATDLGHVLRWALAATKHILISHLPPGRLSAIGRRKGCFFIDSLKPWH